MFIKQRSNAAGEEGEGGNWEESREGELQSKGLYERKVHFKREYICIYTYIVSTQELYKNLLGNSVQ